MCVCFGIHCFRFHKENIELSMSYLLYKVIYFQHLSPYLTHKITSMQMHYSQGSYLSSHMVEFI